MRETVQRKICVMVFEVKEKNVPMKIAREEEEAKKTKEIRVEIVEEGEEIVEQIEKVYWIGKYNKNGTRLMKIRFMSQTAAEQVLQRTGILAKVEGMMGVWLKRDMNEEERNKLKELRVEI